MTENNLKVILNESSVKLYNIKRLCVLLGWSIYRRGYTRDNLYVVTYMYILHLYLVETECQYFMRGSRGGSRGGGGPDPLPAAKLKLQDLRLQDLRMVCFAPLS